LSTFILEKKSRNDWSSQSRATNNVKICYFDNLTIFSIFGAPSGLNVPPFRSRVQFFMLVIMQVKLTF